MKREIRMKAAALVTTGAATLITLVIGCASQQPMGQEAGGMSRVDTPIQDVKGLPEWVRKGGGGETIEGRRVLQGVGSISGVVNPTLRRKSAGAQARNDLAETIRVFTASLLKTYMAETTAGELSNHDVEQRIQLTTRQITAATLEGAQIVDYVEHPLRNEAFALARMDMEEFRNMMKSGRFNNLDADQREWIQKNADKAHDELNEELGKMRQN